VSYLGAVASWPQEGVAPPLNFGLSKNIHPFGAENNILGENLNVEQRASIIIPVGNSQMSVGILLEIAVFVEKSQLSAPRTFFINDATLLCPCTVVMQQLRAWGSCPSGSDILD